MTSTMQSFVKASNHVLDVADSILPRVVLKHCAGVILLSGGQFGWFISAGWASGLLLAKDSETGKFSAPVPVTFDSIGVGLVAGGAATDVVIVLSGAALKSLLAGDGHLKVGAELGFAVLGGVAAGASGISEVLTFNRGLMVSAEITAGGVSVEKKLTKEFYDTDDAAAILAKAAIPEGLVEIVERLDRLAA